MSFFPLLLLDFKLGIKFKSSLKGLTLYEEMIVLSTGMNVCLKKFTKSSKSKMINKILFSPRYLYWALGITNNAYIQAYICGWINTIQSFDYANSNSRTITVWCSHLNCEVKMKRLHLWWIYKLRYFGLNTCLSSLITAKCLKNIFKNKIKNI